MNQTAAPRHPWRALAAAGAMLVVVHGAARAATPELEPTPVRIAGQMPLHQACPSVDDDLPAALSAAWDDAAKPSTVAVTFKVQRHAVFDVVPESDSPRTFHQIRRAVHGLVCSSGDDQARVVRLVVRFVDGTPVAAIADADEPSDDSGRP